MSTEDQPDIRMKDRHGVVFRLLGRGLGGIAG
jgi:hypothetical protein